MDVRRREDLRPTDPLRKARGPKAPRAPWAPCAPGARDDTGCSRRTGGTPPVVRHTDGSLQGTCRAKRALRTQFGRSNNTPAAPCAASGGKPPASGAPIPSYELFSPPEAARAADKYLLHSRRGLGRAAGATSKICLSDARVSQSRHRISSGENPSQSDQTARDSS